MKLCISKSNNPHFNLALESCLFQKKIFLDDEPILYLWQNSKVVVIGRGQNPWKECHLSRMNEDGVLLMRRDTGGGAVFHDMGNLCFSFIGKIKESYRKENLCLICSALKSLGFDAEPNGRNDIESEGLKISGSAFLEKDNRFLHHGTVLISSNLDELGKYLNPSLKKLSSKGVSSVKSRVTNLLSINSEITFSAVMNAISDTVRNHYLENSVCRTFDEVSFDESILESNAFLQSEYSRLTDRDWLYGKTPAFTACAEEKFSWGLIEIDFAVNNGIIKCAKVYTDSLDTGFIEILENALTEKNFERSSLENIAEELSEKTDFKEIFSDVKKLFKTIS